MLYIKTAVVYLESKMKATINDVLVVEGKADASRISTYVDTLIVTTNGYDIPEEELDFLNHLPNGKRILILTDSDSAGQEIRKRLNKLLNHYENITVDISKCNKNNKHGVAECEKEELLKVLQPYFGEPTSQEPITSSALIYLGIDTKDKREYIARELHLGTCNNKTFLKRMNYLQIKPQTLTQLIKQYGNQ